MADNFINRKQELRRYFPKPFYDLKDGNGLAILLDVIGSELDTATSQVLNMRDQLLLSKAVGKWLDVHGVNMDVFRPRGYNMPDNVYRELIKITTNSSKNVEKAFEAIFALYFGVNAVSMGVANVFSARPNELTVVIQKSALIIASSRNLYGTFYLHQGHGAYDGDSLDLWNSTNNSFLPEGSTSITLSSFPTGIPTQGFITFGPYTAPDETKHYYRTGLVLDFLSPTKKDHAAGQAINGPKFPDDYPSGYVYDREVRTDLVGSFLAGVTNITTSPINQSSFPLNGVVYIGDPQSTNFEVKGYTKLSLTSTSWTLEGPLNNPHSSGDPVILPCFPRNIKTTLTNAISAGSSHPEISVVLSANFPLETSAIKLNGSFDSEEIVPFISRKLSDNTKITIDPGYVFQKDHLPGEKVQLMARKTRPSIDGLNFPAYLNDTDSLRFQFFNLLRRIKATGVKINFELI